MELGGLDVRSVSEVPGLFFSMAGKVDAQDVASWSTDPSVNPMMVVGLMCAIEDMCELKIARAFLGLAVASDFFFKNQSVCMEALPWWWQFELARVVWSAENRLEVESSVY